MQRCENWYARACHCWVVQTGVVLVQQPHQRDVPDACRCEERRLASLVLLWFGSGCQEGARVADAVEGDCGVEHAICGHRQAAARLD